MILIKMPLQKENIALMPEKLLDTYSCDVERCAVLLNGRNCSGTLRNLRSTRAPFMPTRAPQSVGSTNISPYAWCKNAVSLIILIEQRIAVIAVRFLHLIGALCGAIIKWRILDNEERLLTSFRHPFSKKFPE